MKGLNGMTLTNKNAERSNHIDAERLPYNVSKYSPHQPNEQ
jgi:hypothetical protein